MENEEIAIGVSTDRLMLSNVNAVQIYDYDASGRAIERQLSEIMRAQMRDMARKTMIYEMQVHLSNDKTLKIRPISICGLKTVIFKFLHSSFVIKKSEIEFF